MTLFLLGYAVGLKDKIKTVMWSLLIAVSVFIVYTSVASTYAQTVTVVETENSPVVYYLNKLFMMQPSWSSSPVYTEGNKAFFTSFKEKLEEMPVSDHLRKLSFTITQIEGLTTQKAKVTYNFDKPIVLALLNGILDMIKNDISEGTSYEDIGSVLHSQGIYDVTTVSHNDESYYILTLNEPNTVKYADFHGEQGSMYHCMYEQCNKLAFLASTPFTEIHISYLADKEDEKISFDGKTSFSSASDSQEDESAEKANSNETITSDNDIDTPVTNTATNQSTDITEDELLNEIETLFSGV